MKIRLQDMIKVSLFTGLMVVGAYVRIPFPFLPLTLQPFFCAFAGILLGSRLGSLSQLLYVVAGLIGLPVFAQGGGIYYIFSPSFGFLAGFIAGAYIIGKLSEKQKTVNLKSCLASVLSGLATIYVTGIAYMYLILHFYLGQHNTGIWVVISGNLPYVAKDLLLFAVVAFTAASAIPALKKAGLY